MPKRHVLLLTLVPVLALVLALLGGGNRAFAAAAVAPPFDTDYSLADLGNVPGLPTQYGGLTFKFDDANTILIGGDANTASGKLYSIGVVRDFNNHIIGFSGTATVFADSGFNNGGVAYGPSNVLFLARWPVNEIGQTKPGSSITDKIISLDPLGVTSSPGGLSFVPAGFPGAGQLKTVVWPSGRWYTLDTVPDGAGTFDITGATLNTQIVGGPEGLVYVPSGSPVFAGLGLDLLIAEWSAGKVAAYQIDTNGDPIPSTRTEFVTGLTGAEGAAIDPLTGDFLFSTFGGGSRVVVVQGFTPPGADVKVTGVTVSCDDPADTNTTFNCDVDATVHNNGPGGPANADVTVGLSAPADCTLTPSGSQTNEDVSLSVSNPVVVSKAWSVTCTDRSSHSFVGTADIQLDQLNVEDPDPSNNSGSGQDTIAVFDLADLKVTGVTVTCDDPVDTNTPFDCTVDVDVHNNGPTTPVNADVTVGLSVPADCTDPADQTQQDLALAASVAQTVSKTFTTECSLRSSHTFSGSGDVQVDQLHVRDPDPSNNSGSGQGANSVFDRADAKVTGVTIDCPAEADSGVPFTCTVETTLHNNGPTTPVDVGGAINVGVPDDCTVENYNLFGQGFGLLSLAVSVSQTASKDFNITCTDNGLHQIVGCAIIQVNQLHVRDQVPVANNYGTATTTTDIVDPLLLLPGRCATLDPVEICGNGIDDDGDTLIDEEPDTDGDGVNNCDDLDDDGDGFSDIVEAYVGTDPLANCPWVVGVHPAWPPDFDDSQDVNIIDVLALKPAFGSTAADANYVPRNDLNADGNINIIDVLTLKPVFGSSCN